MDFHNTLEWISFWSLFFRVKNIKHVWTKSVFYLFSFKLVIYFIVYLNNSSPHFLFSCTAAIYTSAYVSRYLIYTYIKIGIQLVFMSSIELFLKTNLDIQKWRAPSENKHTNIMNPIPLKIQSGGQVSFYEMYIRIYR